MIFLVDCENVGVLNIPKEKQDIVYHFVREEDSIKKKGRNYIVTHHNGDRDALDFCIDSFLGYLIGTYGNKCTYCIVSSDKGFDNVVNFWKAQDISIQRATAKQLKNLPKKENLEQKIEGLIDKLPSKKQKSLYYQCQSYTVNTKKKNKNKDKWYSVVRSIIGDSLSKTQTRMVADYLFDSIVTMFNVA